MTGLLIKDIRILLKRKSALGIFLVVAVMMGMTQTSAFVVGYVSLLVTILALSTIAYDDMDNGMTFIMTLPITKKDYATSKFLFVDAMGIVGWLISLVLCVVLSLFNKSTESFSFADAFAFVPILLIMMAIMIPIQIKFGAEKSRFVMMIIAGIAAVGAFIATKAVGSDTSVRITETLDSLSPVTFDIIILAVAIAATALSYIITVRIIENKSY